MKVPAVVGTPERLAKYNVKAMQRERARLLEAAKKYGVRPERLNELREVCDAEVKDVWTLTGIADVRTRVQFRDRVQAACSFRVQQ